MIYVAASAFGALDGRLRVGGVVFVFHDLGTYAMTCRFCYGGTTMSLRAKIMADGAALEFARKLAEEAHAGQTDKTGQSYFSHCQRVADRVAAPDEKVVAYLHDVVEKGKGWSLERLKEAGFCTDVVEAVDALTRREDETDDQFVIRAVQNSLASSVKIADLQDNLVQALSAGGDPSKYKRGLELIAMVQADPTLSRLA
jgi:hypothetical protein